MTIRLCFDNLKFVIFDTMGPFIMYYVRTGRFQHVHWHLGAKLISVYWLLLMCSSALNWFLIILLFD